MRLGRISHCDRLLTLWASTRKHRMVIKKLQLLLTGKSLNGIDDEFPRIVAGSFRLPFFFGNPV